jgi:HEAT repeat protein
LDWSVNFRFLIFVVYGIAFANMVGALLVIFQIVRMRRLRQLAEKRHRRFLKRWEPILCARRGVVPSLPRLRKNEIDSFIILWNDLAEAPDDEAGEYLNEIARRAGMVPIALRLAQKGSIADRLIAVTMLGLLREESAAQLIESLTKSPYPVLSIAAAHAAVRIDARASRRFLTLRLERDDWPPSKVDAIIEQERAVFAPVLTRAVFTLPQGNRLVRYLKFCDAGEAVPAIYRILDESTDVPTIRAALKVLGQFAPRAGAERAASFLTHENWQVRVQAANALARIGDSTQVSALAGLLEDNEWWVRYRAAQAIADLTADLDILRHIHDSQSDRYARDMLSQVIAEYVYAREPLATAG